MNEEKEAFQLKPSLLATICLIQILQVIVFLLMIAIAWNGGYWKGRDTGFTDMWNATHSTIIQPKTNGLVNPVENYGAKIPAGWEEVPKKNGEKEASP